MGKKRGNRNDIVYQEVVVDSKDQPQLFQLLRKRLEWEDQYRDDFTTWISKELESFQLNAAESPAATVNRLVKFLDDNSLFSCVEKYLGRWAHVVHCVFIQKTEELLDRGELELAKVWSLVKLVLFDALSTEKRKEKELLLDFIEECENSRMLVTRWLLAQRRGWLKANHECKLINILYSSGDMSELDDDHSTSILMEPDTKLTTLLRLIESKINVSNLITDYEVHLNLPEYSFAIDHEFMSRSLSGIGLCDGSSIHIKPKKTRNRGSRSAKRRKQKKKKKQTPQAQSNNGSSSSKKSGHSSYVDYSTNEDEDEKRHRVLLDQVFREAFVVFKARRQRLNDLLLKKCPPKEKSKLKSTEPEPVSHCCSSRVESKPGRTFFPIFVGHEEYLYKSSKASKQTSTAPLTLDLHGCTREEAFHELDSCLPNWIDEAMKEDTCKLPVNIISGSGSQVISDAVEQWIRVNRNVTNRFM